MWLLIFLTILFIAMVSMMLYANWPTSTSSDMPRDRCGCEGRSACSRCPCRRYGHAVAECMCPYCPFRQGRRRRDCQFC